MVCGMCGKPLNCSGKDCGQSIKWVKEMNVMMNSEYKKLKTPKSYGHCFCKQCYLNYLADLYRIDSKHAKWFIEQITICYPDLKLKDVENLLIVEIL